MAQYLYRFSYKEAEANNDTRLWRESYSANVACRDFIDSKIAELYADNHLPVRDIITTACECHGIDRVGWVLANTVRHGVYDGRYRPETLEWAKTAFRIPREDANDEYLLGSHSELINGLVNGYKEYLAEDLKLVSMSQCLPGSYNDDYTGKVLILKADTLVDEYKYGNFQYFFAESGFGCRPESLGMKVFGRFLSDDERCFFSRSDFLGIADPDQLPEWVKNKLDDQDGGHESYLSNDDGGMTLQ